MSRRYAIQIQTEMVVLPLVIFSVVHAYASSTAFVSEDGVIRKASATTLRVFFFEVSLAQATFRIECVDHKLNFDGE